MDEKTIEKFLIEKIKTLGGKAYKFISPGNTGVPDRLVILPGGRVIFVELKATGKIPRLNQMVQIKRLRQLGADVEIIDSKDGVLDFIKNIVCE